MERQVTFVSRGKRTFGFLHVPDGPLPAPGLIYCHGFTGDHIGQNRMVTRFARAASEAGYVTLRFDFIGSGDSEGDFASHTHLTGWLEDLENALNFLSRQEEVDRSRIGTIGLSFGGAAVLCKGDAGGRVKAVATWSAVVHLEKSYRETILGPELWERAEKGEKVKNFYNKGFSLEPGFLDDIKKYHPLEAVRGFNGLPLLIVHATGDEVIDPDHARELYEAAPEPKGLVMIEGDDHVFKDRLADATWATLQWMDQYLKASP